MHLRRVKEQDGKLVNIDFHVVPMVKDPWKEENPSKSQRRSALKPPRLMASAVIILLDGLAYGMVLFIISVGLTVTMGLMRVVNLAHGGFAMAGGYLAAVMVAAGIPFFVAAAVVATLAAGILGGIAELTVFRPLYRKGELAQVLMTFGLTFVFIAALTFHVRCRHQAAAGAGFAVRACRSRVPLLSDLPAVPDRGRTRPRDWCSGC